MRPGANLLRGMLGRRRIGSGTGTGGGPGIPGAITGLAAAQLPGLIGAGRQITGAAGPRSQLSTNIPAVTYYDSTIHFLNLAYQAGDWGYGGGGSIPLRSDGWPTVVTAGSGVYAGFQARIPQSGQYVAFFDGDGDLSVDFGGSVVSHTSNRYVFQLDGSDLGGNEFDRVGILITRSNVANPVRNLVVVPIAHEADHATFLVNEKFLQVIAPFQTLRFMDFFKVNDVGDPYNTTTTPASRITPAYAIQGGAKGPAIEYAVQICNRNKSDLWVCLPLGATTGLLDLYATIIAANLDAPLKVYEEFGNELWNDAFQNGVDVLAMAIAAGFPNAYDSRFGYQAMMGRYFREKLSSLMDPSRVKHVITSHHTFDFRQEITLDYPHSYGLYTDGTPAHQHADLFATAPYFSGERADDPATQTDSVSTIISKMTTIDIPDMIAAITRSRAIADVRGIPFGAYEAGQHLYASDFGDTALQSKLNAVNRDAAMYTCMTAALNGMGAHMNAVMCIYTLCGEYSQYGRWGWMENMYQTINATPRECPKMDAAVAWNLAHAA